jgi:hypothetical protein
VGENRHAYRVLVGKTEGKIQIVGTGLRWEESDTMYLKEKMWKIVD